MFGKIVNQFFVFDSTGCVSDSFRLKAIDSSPDTFRPCSFTGMRGGVKTGLARFFIYLGKMIRRI